MERPASSSSKVVAFLVALAVSLAACQNGPAPARSLDPNAPVVIPYPVAGGGQVRFTVRPRYVVGEPIAVDLDITAGRQAIRGPLSGHVLQSDLGGEQTIRRFDAAGLGRVDVAPGQKAHTTVTWDGKDDTGSFVKQDTYSLSLDLVVGSEPVRLGTVIEVRQK